MASETTPVSDPRPAATEAAHTAMKRAISRASSCYNFIPNPDAMLIALEREGYIIAPIAAAPPSGQVAFTDDEWTCVLAALKITVATCGATDCSDCRTLKSAIDKIPAARKGADR